MIHFPARPAFVLAFALLGLAACGGGTGDTGAGGGGGVAAPITQDVVAAKGGTVTSADKTVSLDIPAGSLGADTKITLTVSAKEEATATSVYTFGPADAVFETPATLVIGTDGITAPAKMRAVMGMKSGTAWAEVVGAKQGSGTLQASVSTLASFSVIFVPAGPCADSCMGQAGAVCCTACGCSAPVACAPVCGSGTMWDCEMQCCFDSTALKCAP
jgi:hypothetical protein